MHRYEKDALDMQAGEQKQNHQREQEAAQRHAEVLQRLHALEKKLSKTKRQENTATTQHDKHEVQQHSPTYATATTDTDIGTVSAAAQHKRDEVDVPAKVAGRKVNAETQNDYVREHQATGADTETATTGAHSNVGEMKADAETFRNEGIRTPTEDTQPHLAGNTAACSLDFSELLGIMKQMQKSTTAQAALVHAQSEKIEYKPSELTTKLYEVTPVMEEQQFELTCRTKVKGTTESDSDKNLEHTISGEPTTINVTKQIGQEHATLTRFTGSQGNNTSTENATKHTNSEKIDSAHETVTQYTFGLSQLKAYGAMHNGEIVGEQKLADDNAQETSENAEEPAIYGHRQSRVNEMANYWIGIEFVF